MIETLIVIAKEPVPGRVKTRLVPALSYQQAADVAGAALADTIAAVERIPVRNRLLALDGEPGAWLPPHWQVTRQPAGGLDLRLVAALSAAGAGPALLVGMDTPQVTVAQLAAFDPDRYEAALGLATDGGYWAIGLRDPQRAAAVITGVPMSTASTGAEQRRRLQEAGLSIQELDQLTDVDTIDTARSVARSAPGTYFAQALTKAIAVARPRSAVA